MSHNFQLPISRKTFLSPKALGALVAPHAVERVRERREQALQSQIASLLDDPPPQPPAMPHDLDPDSLAEVEALQDAIIEDEKQAGLGTIGKEVDMARFELHRCTLIPAETVDQRDRLARSGRPVVALRRDENGRTPLLVAPELLGPRTMRKVVRALADAATEADDRFQQWGWRDPDTPPRYIADQEAAITPDKDALAAIKHALGGGREGRHGIATDDPGIHTL